MQIEEYHANVCKQEVAFPGIANAVGHFVTDGNLTRNSWLPLRGFSSICMKRCEAQLTRAYH